MLNAIPNLRVALLGVLLALPGHAQVTTTLSGRDVNVSVDWSTFNSALTSAFSQALVNDKCGTQARLFSTSGSRGQNTSSARIRGTLDVSRSQCTTTQERECKGLTCRKVTREWTNTLYSNKIPVSIDITLVGVNRRGDLEFRPTFESMRQLESQIGGSVPDFAQIEAALEQRISRSLDNSISSAMAQTIRAQSGALPELRVRGSTVSTSGIQLRLQTQ